TACGGCDTISDFTLLGNTVIDAAKGADVILFEGLVMSQATNVHRRIVENTGAIIEALCLTTPIEECLEAVRARRAAAGNKKPLNEKNTRDAWGRGKRSAELLNKTHPGKVEIIEVDREEAFNYVLRAIS
ncbi:hypothetical protein D6833_09885, partial [Candidatus Parcubacteria bacterium]